MKNVNEFRRLFALATLILLALAPQCFAMTSTAKDIGITAESLLKERRFLELDRLASSYIKDDVRLVGGNAALYHFYGALGSFAESGQYGYSSPVSRQTKQLQLEQWLASRPSSSTAHIALAEFWSNDAWRTRGGEYSNKIPETVWSAFQEKLDRTNAYLTGAGKAYDPHWHYLIIETAKGKSAPKLELDSLYRSAIQQFPTYFHFYSQRAVILQERWFGNAGELSKYNQSLLTQPGGDFGLVAYSYVANTLMAYYPRSTLLNDTGLDWHSIKAGYSARQRLYGLRNRDWNALCNLSLAAVDRATAADALSHIGSDWDPVVWKKQVYFEKAVEWIRSK
jgi:hypothetical protein